MENRTAAKKPAIRTGPIFGIMLVGAFIAFLNQTLINVALPQIMQHLNISAVQANWLITIYMLVNGIVIPVTAFLMERFTTRQLYFTLMTLFTVGTLICGIAPSFSVLLIGRVVQAAGAGILFPLITNVIFTLFPLEKRGAAMGMFGVAINFAPAIGPTLSGWIVESYSWRVLFHIVFPIALLNLIVSFFLIRNVAETSRPKLDVLGVILSTLGFGGVLYGFATAGSSGWSSTNVVATFIVGGVCLVLFIWRQFVVDHPILEFRIFKYRMFTLLTIINVIVTMAMFAGMILMPIYMQNVRGFSPFLSGLMLLPGGVIMGVMSPITGRLFDKMGAKWLAIPGLLITAITTYALAKLDINTSFTYVTAVFTARMFGMAILMMPIFTASLNDLPFKFNRYGTAMVNTLRMVAGAVGMAFFVSVMANNSAIHIRDIVEREQFSLTDKAHMALATARGTAMGINDAFLIATGLTVLSLVLSFFIRKTAPADQKKTEQEKNDPEQKIADWNQEPQPVAAQGPFKPVYETRIEQEKENGEPVAQTVRRYQERAEPRSAPHNPDRAFRSGLRRLQENPQANDEQREDNSDAAFREAIRRFLSGKSLEPAKTYEAENSNEPMGDSEYRRALRRMRSRQK
ncbi:DHA2 family efflux MFS transporter permease subunit [Aneurinibacillus sp. Ricciae_BoGa-3]|uniref:DHA2 family efflux MFS transporter permease subunit n=1 Tax=Aneurinibacillus sp. Ricciae_BoGa-3 TaxID=3022697 RepID=UPI002341CA15|nr:DHA2 family efflux MFS transporter permease subunit [Aneurinibacillus sp. Ricciae_BoGa-3]WCK52386.1 DHA2 family efflux MFS transporter permease subunit [Aneurinibacillus sp. Ricciae_BoGa-3]